MSGLRRNFGTMTKPFHVGNAARTAVVSVSLAKRGLTSDEVIFDGDGGVIQTYGGGDGEPVEQILATLADPWDIVDPGNCVKRWPCCYSGPRAIAALYDMIDKHGIAADDVEEITVSFLPGGDTALLSTDPKTGLEGKFSIEYMAAAILLDGPLKMATFTDPMVQRPEVRRLMQKVRRIHVPDEKFYSGMTGHNDIVVTTRHGRFEMREERVPGSRGWPLSEKDRDDKFLDCATAARDEAAAGDLLSSLKAMRSLADVGRLAKATMRNATPEPTILRA
jgi:2-methylcitrate dehydratase PrpD